MSEVTYEEKVERFLAPVNRLIQYKRVHLRTFGPRIPLVGNKHISLVRDPDQMVIFKCGLCQPPEEMLTCTTCGYSVPVTSKWLMRMHNDNPPKHCTDTAAKIARRHARQA